MKTQNERILWHLKKQKVITALQAMMLYGIYRLSARIYDLRKAGHKITSKTAAVKNRYGQSTHITLYRLEK